MRLVVLSVLILTMTSCKKKRPWTKEYLTQQCNKEFSKKNETDRLFTPDQLKILCDCVATKMIATYKSEAELKKDKTAQEQIGSDCAREALK